MAEAQPSADQGQGDATGMETTPAEASGEAGPPSGQQSAEQLPDQQPQHPEMPPEYAHGFAQVLAALNGSRVRPLTLRPGSTCQSIWQSMRLTTANSLHAPLPAIMMSSSREARDKG